MACQPISDIRGFEARTRITRQRVRETRRLIYRIEAAKSYVCGVPAADTLSELRRGFEGLLPLLEENYRLLNSGRLDTMADEELRQLVTSLQERDAKLSDIYEGSVRIGLAAVEPFPRILEDLKAYQGRLQSQIEGILLSLSSSFQDLVEKSAQELNPSRS